MEATHNEQISASEVRNSRTALKREWSDPWAETGIHGMVLNFPEPPPPQQSSDTIVPIGRRLYFYFLERVKL